MERRARGERAYRHQSLAIAELRGPAPRPVVVTTGTGSGKTEAFLLPAIQHAIEDAVRFARPGLTALLVYPMNALANDQQLRIEEYLGASRFAGLVSVERYDRGTSDEDRQRLRRAPPRILLTNYMLRPPHPRGNLSPVGRRGRRALGARPRVGASLEPPRRGPVDQ